MPQWANYTKQQWINTTSLHLQEKHVGYVSMVRIIKMSKNMLTIKNSQIQQFSSVHNIYPFWKKKKTNKKQTQNYK